MNDEFVGSRMVVPVGHKGWRMEKYNGYPSVEKSRFRMLFAHEHARSSFSNAGTVTRALSFKLMKIAFQGGWKMMEMPFMPW